MNITINGKLEAINNSLSIMEFLKEKSIDPNSVVIEYNYDIVKQEQWDQIVLKENDTLEVLRFVGGG